MRKVVALALVILCLSTSLVLAETRLQTGIDPEATLPYWEISDTGMSLRLVQRLPDQTRGFFLARGFAKAEVELIAQSCVFQTVFKNESHKTQPSPLEYNLLEWVVISADKQQGLKLREDWKQEWQQRKIPLAVQLAFEWALYPTRQIYKPGDYNWGMSTFNLKPGTRFDLKVVWQQYGTTHTTVIKDIECAADVHLEPEGVQ